MREPAFPGDDGRADPALREAMTADSSRAHDMLRRARLLVPVLAEGSDMVSVSMIGRDGRRAMLAFTGLDALHAWRPDARPVPVRAVDAAAAAIAESADALVIDLAGPRQFVVDGSWLLALAQSSEGDTP